jgi:hypothetical protein
MLNILANLLLLSAVVGPVEDTSQVDSVEIFHCDFSTEVWDINFDQWPDTWVREFGPDLPQFVEAKLQPEPGSSGGQCLQVALNGGSALVHSQPIAVSSSYAYVLGLRVRGEGVKYSQARVRLDFCTEDLKVVESINSDWFQNTRGWRKINFEPVNHLDQKVEWAIVTLEVHRGSSVDLDGYFALDDLSMSRQPRMSVYTNSPFNVYNNPQNVIVTCELSGIRQQDPDIHFQLLDASSNQLDDNTVQLAGRLITEKKSKASSIIDQSVELPAGYAGQTQWHPPIQDYGFYRVRVSMQTSQGSQQVHLISIAVVPPIKTASRGEFGWSLTGDELPLDFEQLRRLLPHTGISWVKLPVWYGTSEVERADDLLLFAEQMDSKKIDLVGVLDRPPKDLDLQRDFVDDLTVADLFANVDPSVWQPSLDEVLTRLSLKVKYWQLGLDTDTSFAHSADAVQRVASLREKLFRFGQDVNLGIGWPWLVAEESMSRKSWDFEQMSASPSLATSELSAYLSAPTPEGVVRWTLIQPLSRKHYDLETRTRDLVQQMMTAKIEGAAAIFAARPFDDENGLMTDSGSPTDLLLPWRTTATLLSGTQFVGSLQLPGGSENRLFEDDRGQMVMVIWNQQPCDETIEWGDTVQVVDAWGRAEETSQSRNHQVIRVGTMPRFVTGINARIARMMMGVQFSQNQLPCKFDGPLNNHLEFDNPFPHGIGGIARVVGPEGWKIIPERIDFKLGAGEKMRRPIQIVLPIDAASGDVPFRVDLEVQAEKLYKFSMYRQLTMGDPDIQVEVATRLDEDGVLVVDQRMINTGNTPTDFKCFLYALNRPRQRVYVFQLANNWDLKSYRFPDGADLLGEVLLLKVEELGGQKRVINHRFTIDE